MFFNSSQGPLSFTLPQIDKTATERVLQNTAEDAAQQRDDFARRFTDEQHPAWRRYVDGIYNHPKTWWIGIIQTQMILGMWGEQRKAEASIRQSTLARILHQLTTPSNRAQSEMLISEAVRFNLKHRKADITGRFHGGLFTNYASMGGRRGAGIPGQSIKWAGRITNLTIASFGAAIAAIAANRKTAEDILNAIITGKTERLPGGYKSLAKNSSNTATQELEILVSGEVYGVEAFNRVLPAPMPIHEFCSRPENASIRSLCQ